LGLAAAAAVDLEMKLVAGFDERNFSDFYGIRSGPSA
jgi:hypothetical protein